MSKQQISLQRRYRNERWLVRLGQVSVILALVFLLGLVGSVVHTGWRALLRADIAIDVAFDPVVIGAQGEGSVLDYGKLLRQAVKDNFPAATAKRRGAKAVRALFSELGAAIAMREAVQAQPDLVGSSMRMWVPASSLGEGYLKGSPQSRIKPAQQQLLDELSATARTRLGFNLGFFVNSDSRSPELAGIGGALVGSVYLLLLTFLVAFPMGVGAAVYLEQFAPRNRWFDIIEININNLAAVPSIIMGLLGLAVFLNLFGMPRSSALAGGMVIALMTLPTIIIAARAAIKAVPPNLLEGAMSLGATRLQANLDMVLPAAMPGILTGTIIGMAQALGETAPLLMIGMVAFVASVPEGFTDAATALPVQVFLWADQPERGYVEKTALAICVLLGFLLVMNAAAIYLRKRLEVNQ